MSVISQSMAIMRDINLPGNSSKPPETTNSDYREAINLILSERLAELFNKEFSEVYSPILSNLLTSNSGKTLRFIQHWYSDENLSSIIKSLSDDTLIFSNFNLDSSEVTEDLIQLKIYKDLGYSDGLNNHPLILTKVLEKVSKLKSLHNMISFDSTNQQNVKSTLIYRIAYCLTLPEVQRDILIRNLILYFTPEQRQAVISLITAVKNEILNMITCEG